MRKSTYIFCAKDTLNKSGGSVIPKDKPLQQIIQECIDSNSFIPKATICIREGSYIKSTLPLKITKPCTIYTADCYLLESNTLGIVELDCNNIHIKGINCPQIFVNGNNCVVNNCYAYNGITVGGNKNAIICNITDNDNIEVLGENNFISGNRKA